MNNPERKVEKSFVYMGFGFPVKLYNVEMVRFRGKWEAKINTADVAAMEFDRIASGVDPLTTEEVTFVLDYQIGRYDPFYFN